MLPLLIALHAASCAIDLEAAQWASAEVLSLAGDMGILLAAMLTPRLLSRLSTSAATPHAYPRPLALLLAVIILVEFKLLPPLFASLHFARITSMLALVPIFALLMQWLWRLLTARLWRGGAAMSSQALLPRLTTVCLIVAPLLAAQGYPYTSLFSRWDVQVQDATIPICILSQVLLIAILLGHADVGVEPSHSSNANVSEDVVPLAQVHCSNDSNGDLGQPSEVTEAWFTSFEIAFKIAAAVVLVGLLYRESMRAAGIYQVGELIMSYDKWPSPAALTLPAVLLQAFLLTLRPSLRSHTATLSMQRAFTAAQFYAVPSSIYTTQYIASALPQARAAPQTPYKSDFQRLKPELYVTYRDKYNLSAIVFYGRRDSVSILNSYLERNLVSNGGLLHEVVFVTSGKTTPADEVYLELILAQHPQTYRKVSIVSHGWDFSSHYAWMDPSRYYVKIDDDTVWIEDGTIEAMLEEKLRDRYLFVSANVINHPLLSSYQHRMGMIVEYEPYRTDSTSQSDSTIIKRPWRATGVPSDQVPNDWHGPWWHGDCTWGSWRCSAITHHNLLHHARHDNLSHYSYDVHDFHQDDINARWSINFFILNSDDILGKVMGNDDEQTIAVEMTKQTGRHSAAVGTNATVSHYAYFPQRPGLNAYTNVMDQYRDLALEKCGRVLHGQEVIVA
ncbi:hypothetical protein RI367_007581 [Sorochytrium milnesiophthora]